MFPSTNSFGQSFEQQNNSRNNPFGSLNVIQCFLIHPNHFIGSPVFAQKPAFVGLGFTPIQTSPFGSDTQQAQPAFGNSIFGSSTPFGASFQPSFGDTSTPAIGATITLAFGSTPAFGSIESAFESHTPTPAFGNIGIGQSGFRSQQGGSRVASYTATSEINSDNIPPRKLESISAMTIYKDKSHEELRWEDYQLGDKGSSAFGQNLAFGGFGSTTQTRPFGSTTQPSRPAFGSSIFGSSTHFGASQTAFGSTGTPAFGATGTLGFGASSQPASGSTGIPGFGATGIPGFGASSQPAFGSTGTPAFGATGTPGFGASSHPAFGSTGTPAFGGSSQPAFGSTSTPAFGASSQSAFGSTGIPGFGATSTPAFGSSSQPAFGSTSTPALGATRTRAYGSSSTPAFGSTGGACGMSSTPVFGGGGAFGASSSPVFGSSSTSAFAASSSPAFGASSTPAISFGPFTQAFGQSSSAFGSSSPFDSTTSAIGGQSSALGSQTPTQAFGSTGGIGQSGFGGQQGGSRVLSYSATTETDSGNTPPGKLVSISAMPAYKGKSHEELRWEDYQLGDKGGPVASAPQSTGMAGFNSYTAQTNAFSASPVFGQSSANLFSSTTPNSNPFSPKTSTYSSSFGTSAPAFSSSAFGSSTTAAAPSILSSSTSSFGANSSSQALGSSSSVFNTAAQGTSSPFGLNIFGNTQPSQLFSSATPANAQSSPAFGQNTSPVGKTAVFSQSSLSSSPSSRLVGTIFPSSGTPLASNALTGFGQTAPSLSTPLQSAQPVQSSGTFSLRNFGQTQPVCASSFIGTPYMFVRNNHGLWAILRHSTVAQAAAPITNSFGSLPALPVQDIPATIRRTNSM